MKKLLIIITMLSCSPLAYSAQSNADFAAMCANVFLTIRDRQPKNSPDWNATHNRAMEFTKKASQYGGDAAIISMANGATDISSSLKQDPSLYQSAIIPAAKNCNASASRVGLQ